MLKFCFWFFFNEHSLEFWIYWKQEAKLWEFDIIWNPIYLGCSEIQCAKNLEALHQAKRCGAPSKGLQIEFHFSPSMARTLESVISPILQNKSGHPQRAGTFRESFSFCVFSHRPGAANFIFISTQAHILKERSRDSRAEDIGASRPRSRCQVNGSSPPCGATWCSHRTGTVQQQRPREFSSSSCRAAWPRRARTPRLSFRFNSAALHYIILRKFCSFPTCTQLCASRSPRECFYFENSLL